MIWARLLDYEPVTKVKDSGTPGPLQAVLESGRTNPEYLLDAYQVNRKHNIPVTLEVVDRMVALIKAKPAHRPKMSESELELRSQMYEIAALELGRLRLGYILDGEKCYASKAEVELHKKWPLTELKPGTRRYTDFCSEYRKAILLGEIRELARRLESGETTIEKGFRQWVEKLTPEQAKITAKARDRLELFSNKIKRISRAKKQGSF
ncbi:hypothetical protein MASR1M90_14560 [Desulfovibrionales bacterium]